MCVGPRRGTYARYAYVFRGPRLSKAGSAYTVDLRGPIHPITLHAVGWFLYIANDT